MGVIAPNGRLQALHRWPYLKEERAARTFDAVVCEILRVQRARREGAGRCLRCHGILPALHLFVFQLLQAPGVSMPETGSMGGES